jgi:hypothetical protein
MVLSFKCVMASNSMPWPWFLMATHSNGISALQLQSQLSLGSYRTAWMLAAKLRRAMGRSRSTARSSGVVVDFVEGLWCG